MTIVLGLTDGNATSLYLSELEPEVVAGELGASEPGGLVCPLMADYLVLDAGRQTRFRVLPFTPDTWRTCMRALAECDPIAALLLK